MNSKTGTTNPSPEEMEEIIQKRNQQKEWDEWLEEAPLVVWALFGKHRNLVKDWLKRYPLL